MVDCDSREVGELGGDVLDHDLPEAVGASDAEEEDASSVREWHVDIIAGAIHNMGPGDD